jgi:hypothetical protein
MSLAAIWKPYRRDRCLSVPIIQPELLQHTELRRNKVFEGKKNTFPVKKWNKNLEYAKISSLKIIIIRR